MTKNSVATFLLVSKSEVSEVLSDVKFVLGTIVCVFFFASNFLVC